MKIVIDVGHARGTGARGNGLEEHAECEALAMILSSKLQLMGLEVDVVDYPFLSNRDDLNRTIERVNAGAYDYGISLHCDASSNAGARGAHVCYVSGKGKALARAIAGPLCALLGGRSEGVVLRRDLAVLKRTSPVFVLCECGFITHSGDARVIDANKEAVADAIAEGVHRFLEA